MSKGTYIGKLLNKIQPESKFHFYFYPLQHHNHNFTHAQQSLHDKDKNMTSFCLLLIVYHMWCLFVVMAYIENLCDLFSIVTCVRQTNKEDT